nr:MAG TPA: hypothetical protein [Caudoviricetes sp.]
MRAYLPIVSTNVPTISDLRGIERRCHYVRFVLPPLVLRYMCYERLSRRMYRR